VGKGTGMGLSVCYGVVQEHHGEIQAKNWERGARVIITLPIGEPAMLEKSHESIPQPLPISAPALRLRALVVDDEEMLLRLQISYLKKMGLEVEGVATGEEGLRYLQDHDADIIISDVRMPGPVDGVQLYQWVRENKPELVRRFLFASGDLVGLNLDEFFLNTGAMCLQKPFKLDDYARAIHQVLKSGGTPE